MKSTQLLGHRSRLATDDALIRDELIELKSFVYQMQLREPADLHIPVSPRLFLDCITD